VLFEVIIDTNHDRVADFAIINWNRAQAGGALDADDVFVAATIDLHTATVVGIYPLNGRLATIESAPFGAEMLVLPVAAGNLGLTPIRAASSTTS
jgi:hypothetical protein